MELLKTSRPVLPCLTKCGGGGVQPFLTPFLKGWCIFKTAALLWRWELPLPSVFKNCLPLGWLQRRGWRAWWALLRLFLRGSLTSWKKVTETAKVNSLVAMRVFSVRAQVRSKGLVWNLLAIDLCQSFFSSVYLKKQLSLKPPILVMYAAKGFSSPETTWLPRTLWRRKFFKMRILLAYLAVSSPCPYPGSLPLRRNLEQQVPVDL